MSQKTEKILQLTDFSVEDHLGATWTLAQFNQANIVLYFYPKDSTPGCTSESKDFAALYSEFTALGWQVVGISKDSLSSHQKFAAKYDLPFPLLADTAQDLCQQFDVLKQKSMFGRTYMGIERSTFIIEKGQIEKDFSGLFKTF